MEGTIAEFEKEGLSEDQQLEIMILMDEAINEIIRKEQGWNVKKQKAEGGKKLTDEERGRLRRLTESFAKMGGRKKFHELKDKFPGQDTR